MRATQTPGANWQPRLGGGYYLTVANQHSNVMTTIDPVSGARGPEPLRTLATYRAEGGSVVAFGSAGAPHLCARVGEDLRD
jgi:hypothetical protein